MKKILKIVMIISLVLTIICPILYNNVGSKVLSDGTLEEPFYLVVFMWFFLFIFLLSFIALLFFRKKKEK